MYLHPTRRRPGPFVDHGHSGPSLRTTSFGVALETLFDIDAEFGYTEAKRKRVLGGNLRCGSGCPLSPAHRDHSQRDFPHSSTNRRGALHRPKLNPPQFSDGSPKPTDQCRPNPARRSGVTGNDGRILAHAGQQTSAQKILPAASRVGRERGHLSTMFRTLGRVGGRQSSLVSMSGRFHMIE